MLETIATSANRDKGIYDKDCLKISKIPDLIDAAFKDFSESPSTIFQRHVKFNNSISLSNFFNALFIDNDLSVLKKPTPAWVHPVTESSSSVPGENAGAMTTEEESSMDTYDDSGNTNGQRMETDNDLYDGMENDNNRFENGQCEMEPEDNVGMDYVDESRLETGHGSMEINDDGNGLDFGQWEAEYLDDSSATLSATESGIANIKDFDECMTEKDESTICQFCGKQYTDKYRRKYHLLNVHNYCVTCNITLVDMNIHSKVDHLSKYHVTKWARQHIVATCDICGVSLVVYEKSKAQIIQHMQTHSATQYTCKIDGCNKHFYNRKLLSDHRINCHYAYKCELCNLYYIGSRRYYVHRKEHTCRDINCGIIFKDTNECFNHERDVHYKLYCDICKSYCPSSVNDFFKHKKTCDFNNFESDVRKAFNDNFQHLNSTNRPQQQLPRSQPSLPKPSLLSKQPATLHQQALFTFSILLEKDVAGNVIFDSTDGYPFFSTRLVCPFFGSHSTNSQKNSSNAVRNNNLMRPWGFKPYSHETFLIGTSCVVQYNLALKMPEYSFQLFILKDWIEFKSFKDPRSKHNKFGKNIDLPKDQQAATNKLDDNHDRGHLTPFQFACSHLDQQQLQYQGNIFYQLAVHNRGAWKKLESDILKNIQARVTPRCHITTGVIYERRNKEIVFSRGVAMVGTYYKVVVHCNEDDEILDINCYMLSQKSPAIKVVPRVSLYDIDTIEGNYHKFLNADIHDRIKNPKLLAEHSRSWIT